MIVLAAVIVVSVSIVILVVVVIMVVMIEVVLVVAVEGMGGLQYSEFFVYRTASSTNRRLELLEH